MALKVNKQPQGANDLAAMATAQFVRPADWRRRTPRERFDKDISVAIRELVKSLDVARFIDFARADRFGFTKMI